ncbi:hypothetical protein [Anaerocolumna sp.]|uniref:hypothetical protein n=1 Tax=Anaerocolumna sp. TaxID=2041569 RepID=UPI0028A63CC3|nr:hypothetical protein [Anaerocolumna sp.]
MNEKGKFLIMDWCETHLALLTAISSILGIGVTGLFKCISYWYEKGYYDFWGIPLIYMEIDYNNILMQFLLNFSFIVIIIAAGIIYIEIYNSSKLRGKVVLHILLFFINAGIITYAIYRVGGTINDIFDFSNHETLATFIGAEIIIYILELIVIICFSEKKPKKEKIKGIKRSKQKLKENKREETRIQFLKKETAIYMLVLVVYVIAVINWICYVFYNDRKDKCEDTQKFGVLLDDDNQEYVILTTYDDKYFIKPCTVSEEQVGGVVMVRFAIIRNEYKNVFLN